MDTVTHAHLLGQQIRVGYRPAKLVPTLRLGTPMDAAIALNSLAGSINRPCWVVVEQTIDPLAEDKLADQPPAIQTVG